MKDTEYLFTQTSRERKQLARNAKYKKNGSKSRRCTLPSDNLTPSQKKGLSGPMLTYNLDQPHTLAELKDWPTDLRHEYMNKLIHTYLPDNLSLSLMLGCKQSSISYILDRHFDIRRPRSYTPSKDPATLRQWEQFIGVAPDPEPIPEPVTPTPEPVVQHRASSPIAYDTISVSFTGTADDLIGVFQTGPLHLSGADTYTFVITATRKEVD